MKKWMLAACAAALVAAGCGGGGGSSGGDATAVKASGPITGFGSVIVNGVHYETEGSEIEIDDAGGRSQNDLAVGQVVTIEADDDGSGRRKARRVRYHAEVEGNVESIDSAAGTLVVLSQTVAVTDATVFVGVTDLSGVAVGNRVEVSGARDASGTILASFLKKESASSTVSLRGPVSLLDTAAKTFSIGTLVVDYTAAELKPSTLVLADGLVVEVKGALASGVLQATRVQQERRIKREDRGSEAEVEGPIVSVSGSSFVIDDTTVTVDGSTRYERGTVADLVPGARVEAEGSIQADGSLLAKKIEFRTPSLGRFEAAIESVDTTASTITLLGVTLNVTTATSLRDERDEDTMFALADLQPGDFVEVAIADQGGALVALKIRREDASSVSVVRGPVQTADAGTNTLTIAGVTIDTTTAAYRSATGATLTPSAFYAAATVGTQLKVRGTYAGGVLTATQVQLDYHGYGEDDGEGHHRGDEGSDHEKD